VFSILSVCNVKLINSRILPKKKSGPKARFEDVLVFGRRDFNDPLCQPYTVELKQSHWIQEMINALFLWLSAVEIKLSLILLCNKAMYLDKYI